MARAFIPARAACAAFIALLLGGCSSLLGIDHEYERAEGGGGEGGGASATGTSSSASGLPSTSASSGGPGAEDCLDNIDNDGDSDVDCADADCQPGFECVQGAAAGWEGYFRVRTTPYPNASPTMCPDGSAPSTYFHSPAPAACSACSCGAWSGGACAPPTLELWQNSTNCAGAAVTDLSALVSGNACVEVPDQYVTEGVSRSVKMTTGVVANMGSCPASGGAVMASPLWQSQDDVCGGVIAGGGGCAGSTVCVPRGTGDYNTQVCIRKPGSDACPAGWENSIQMATGGVDNRSCSACQCNVSGVACVGGSYRVYEYDNCQGGNSINIVGMSCVNVTDQLDTNTGSLDPTLPELVSGACSPSGGAPTGSVTPQEVITFCCQ